MSPIEGASADPGAMNVYAYEFRACPGEGTTPGGWELHLLHNGKAVEDRAGLYELARWRAIREKGTIRPQERRQ